MYITLKLSGNLPKNTAVSYDSSAGLWTTAQNTDALIGIIKNDPFQDPETLAWYAPVVISGQDLYISAARQIPDEGGFMHIENGKAYVNNSSWGCGIIAPRNFDAETRQTDDLILVHLR